MNLVEPHVARPFWRKRTVLVAAAVIIAVGGIVAAIAASRDEGPDTSIVVTRGSISETVSVTGQVVASVSVDLAFGASGRISQAPASIGDHVVTGQLLAALDSAELSAQLRDAQANVVAQQALLDEMRQGGSPEEVAISEASVRSAEQDLQSTYDDTYRALSEAYTSADYALRIRLEPLFERISNDDPSYHLTFDTTDYTREAAAINSREDAEIALNQWLAVLNSIASGASSDAYRAAVADSLAFLQRISDAVTAVAALFDGTINLGLEADTEEDYRSRVNSARSDVTTAITTVNSHDRDIKTDELDLAQARSELSYTIQGSTTHQIAAQQAKVQSAIAQVERIRALISKNTIRSPIAGIVTRQDAKIGQTATAGEVLVSVIADRALRIEANVPEVDIGLVSLGDPISVTVDALPGEEFTGLVTFIEPAETVVDGVINFKVTFLLDGSDVRLRSGMTVNIDIVTERQDQVLLLPQYAIIENDEGTFVRSLDGALLPVVLGLRSQDGFVQIISGLSEGMRVQNIGLKANGK